MIFPAIGLENHLISREDSAICLLTEICKLCSDQDHSQHSPQNHSHKARLSRRRSAHRPFDNNPLEHGEQFRKLKHVFVPES